MIYCNIYLVTCCWQKGSNSLWASTSFALYETSRKQLSLPVNTSKPHSNQQETSTALKLTSQQKVSTRFRRNGKHTSEETPLTYKPITTSREYNSPTSELSITQLSSLPQTPPSASLDAQVPPTKTTTSPTNSSGSCSEKVLFNDACIADKSSN